MVRASFAAVVIALVASSTAFAQTANTPTSPAQVNSDATALCAGCVAKSNGALLSASSPSTSCDAAATYFMEYEVRLHGSSYTGTPTHTSAGYGKATCSSFVTPQVSVTGLSTGHFKWRVRERVSTSESAWVEFNAGNRAFSVAGPASRLVITSAATDLTMAQCSAAITVQSQDAHGTPVAVTASTTVTFAAGNGTFYSDSGCGTAASTAAIASGATTTQLYWRPSAAGTISVTANATGLSGAVQARTVQSAVLAFSNAPSSRVEGQCSAALTVQHRNAAGTAVAVTAPLPLTLSTNRSGYFYSDSTCTTRITAATIASGASAVTFYYRGLTAEGHELSAAAEGYATANQLQTFTACKTAGTAWSPHHAPASTLTGIDLAGFAFTPLKPGVITQLCGNFPTASTRRAGLFNRTTNEQLAEANIVASTANTWACVNVPPVRVAANTQYFVYVHAAGGSYHSQPSVVFPKTTGDIRIDTACYASSEVFGDACATTTTTMRGTVDISFAADVSTAVAITTPAQTVLRSNCSPPATASLVGCNGAIQRPSAATNVTLSSTSGTLTFYAESDTTCATALTQLSIPASADGVKFRFKDSTAGTPTITAASTGLTSGTQAQSITSAPTHLSFISAPQSLVNGECATAFRVQTQTATGSPANVTASTTVSFSATNGSFFSNATCTTAATTAAIAAGANTATIYWRPAAAGAATVTATATGYTAGTQVQQVSAAQLGFSTVAQDIREDTCSGVVTVQTRNAAGAAVALTSSTVVTLTSSSPTLQFFSNSSCTAAIGTATIAANTTSASFYFRDSTWGQPNVTASNATARSASQLHQISGPNSREYPYEAGVFGEARYAVLTTTYKTYGMRFRVDYEGNIERLCALIDGSATISLFNSNNTTAVRTAQLTGAANGGSGAWKCTSIPPVAVTPGTTWDVAVELTADTVAFYADDACYAACTATQLPITRQSVTLTSGCYGTTAGADPCRTATVEDSAYGLVDIGFTPLLPTKLSFTSAAQTLPTGRCSDVLVVSADRVNPPSNGAYTVNLSTSLSGVTFHAETDTSCATPLTTRSLAAGAGEVRLRIKSTASGNATLTAAATGLVSGTQAQSFTATQLKFTNAPYALTLGACTGALTVQNQNGAGGAVNVTTATVVALATNLTGTFYSNAGCTSAITGATIASGTSSVTVYYKGELPGDHVLTASAANTAAGTQIERFNPCNATVQPWAPTSAPGTSNYCCFNLTGYVFTPLKPGVATQLCAAWPVAGTRRVGLFRRSDGELLADVQITSSGSTSCVNIPPVALDANAQYHVYTDNVGLGYHYQAVTLPITTGAVRIDSACYNSGGTFGQACSSTSTTTMRGTADVTYAADEPTAVAFTGPAQSVATSSCSAAAEIAAVGCNGSRQRLAAATTVSLSSNSGTMSFYAESDTTCSTPLTALTIPANGNEVRFRFKDSAVGTPTITAAVTGLTSGSQAQTIASAGATQLAFTTSAKSLSAGACSTGVTVQARDSANNPTNVASATAVSLSSSSAGNTFYSDSGCTASVTSVSIAAGTSSQTYYFKDTSAGSPTHTATVTGLTPATQAHAVSALSATRLAFTSPVQTLTANNCSAAATVQSQDTHGNSSAVTAATTVNVSSSLSGVTFYSNATCTTAVSSLSIAAGASSGTVYFKGTTAGTTTLTGAATGFTSATQSATFNAAAPAALAFSTAARTVTAGGCSAVVTVQSRDIYGNASAVSSATTVNLAASPTGGTFYSDSSCLTAVAAAVISAGGSSASYYFKDTRAGSPSHTASATGLSAASQTHTVTPGAVNKLAFANSPVTLAAGSCSSALTVQTQDSFGNASAVTASTTVTLSRTSSAGAFSASSSCGSAITSVVLAAGSSSAVVYYSDTLAGSSTLTAAATGLTSGTQGATVVAASPAKLWFVTAPKTLAVGSCATAVTVSLRDAFDNTATATSSTTVSLASSSATTVFNSDSACNSAVGGVTIAAGGSSLSFYFEDTRSGSHTLTASAAGLTAASQVQTLQAGGVTQLAFSNTPRTVTAGSCSASLTVATRDAYGNAATAASNLTVTLSGPSGATFYSDSGCVTQISSVAINTGQGSATAYFKATAAGSATLTAAATGLTSGTQAQTVNAAAPTVLAFTTAAQTVAAGNCSAVTQVQSRDAYANPSVVSSATTVNLTASAGSLSFYSDAACTAQVTQVTLPLGGSSAGFYFKDTVQGSPTITAAATGMSSGTQTQSITAGSATRLTFLTSSQNVVAGGCSAVMTVQSQDGIGNAVNVAAATTVSVSSTATASGRFYSNSGCTTEVSAVTIAAGTSSVGFYYKDTLAGSPTVTASAAGYTNAAQAQTVRSAAPSKLAFASAAQTVTAGSCSAAALVQARDPYDNVATVTAATSVTLSSSSSGNTFYSDSGCTAAISAASIATGGSQVSFYFKDNVAGTPTLTGAAGGLTSGTQAQTINAGAPARLAYVTAARTITAGGCSALVEVQSQDSLGNAAPAASATAVSLSGTSYTFFSDSGCTNAVSALTLAAGASKVSYHFSSTLSGARAQTASGSGLTSGSQTQTVNAGPVVSLAFSSAAQTVTAGACSAITTVRGRDSYDNNATFGADTAVTLSASMSGLTFHLDSACGTAAITAFTIASGTQARTLYWRPTLAGSPELRADATGLVRGAQTQTVNAAAPSRLQFTSAAQTLAAGSCSGAVTVQSQDVNGNGANLAAATAVNLSSSSTGNTFYSDSSCTTAVAAVTIASGASSVDFYFKDTRAGSASFTASATGLSSASQTQTVNAASPSQLAFIGASQSLAAGSCSAAIQVELRDAFGNPSPAATSTAVSLSSTSSGNTFHTTSACGTAVTQVSVASGATRATLYFKDTRAGSPTLTAAVAGLTSATQTHSISAGSPSRLGFANSPVTVTAGNCSNALTLQSQDSFGNPVPVTASLVVTLSTASPDVTLHADSSCGAQVTTFTIPAGGQTVNAYFKGTIAGTVTVTADATGFTSGTQNQTINAGAPAKLSFPDPAQTVTAGACADATRVERQDAYGNGVKGGGALTVSLASSSTAGRFYSNASCGTQITTVTISSSQTGANVYWRDTTAGSPVLTASAGGLSSGTQTQTVNATTATALAFTTTPQVVTAGGCSAQVRVEVRDTYQNAVPQTSARTVTLSTTSTGGDFYSDASCNTPVTSITIAAGGSSAVYYFRDELAGAPVHTVTAAGLTSASLDHDVEAGAPARLSFLSAPKTPAAGACSSAVQLELQDAYGNPSNAFSSVAVLLSSSSPDMTFYSDATCGAAIASLTVPAGSRVGVFHFKDTRAGAPVITLSATGLTSGTQTQTISAAAPTRLVFSTPAHSVAAGSCSPATTIQARDQYGNAAQVTTDQTVALASSSSGGRFFSDSACGAQVTTQVLPAGAAAISVYFTDTVAGAPTLSASAGALTPASQVQTVVAATPSALAFITPAQTVTAGACSAVQTVQSRDGYGNPSTVSSATAVTLSSSGSGTFYSDASCTSAITSVTLAAGASQASMYFKEPTEGTRTHTAARTGWTSGSLTHTVDPAPPSTLVFTTAAKTLSAGSCSTALTVQLQDNLGAPSNVAASTTISLLSTSAQTVFYADGSCGAAVTQRVMAAGTSSITFYFKDTAAGAPTVTASSPGFTSGNQTQTVNAAAASSLVFTTAARTLTAGSCSPVVSVQTVDAYGNPAAATTARAVSLATDSTGGTFYSDAACGAAVAGITIPVGSSTGGFYFKDTRAGASALTVSSTGLTSSSQTQTVNAAAPAKLVFTTPSRSVTAGSCSAVVTAQSQDSFGNPSPVAAATAVGLSSTSVGNTFHATSSCGATVASVTLGAGSSSVNLFFKDTRAGAPTLTASSSGLTSGAQAQSVSAGAPSVLAFTSAPLTLTAGACSTALTVQTRDSFGNPANVTANTVLSLATGSAGGAFHGTSACGAAVTGATVASGTSSATFYYRDTRAGSAAVTVSGTGFTGATQTQTVVAGAASRLAFTSPVQTMTAGGCSAAFTVQSQDAFGNASAVTAATTVSLSTSSAEGALYATASCGGAQTELLLAAGASSATFYYGDVRAGSATLTAGAATLAAATQAVSVTAAAAAKVAVLTPPRTAVAGSCSAAVNLEIRDAYDNAAAGTSARIVSLSATSGATAFFTDAACGAGATTVTVAAGSANATTYFSGTAAGAYELAAASSGLTEARQAYTISSAAASRLAFVTASHTVVAGSCSPAVTLEAQDSYGNAVAVSSALAVTVSSSSGGAAFFSDDACSTSASGLTIASGATRATVYFRDTVTGAPLLTAAASGLGSANQPHTVTSAAPSQLAITSAPQTLVAGNCSLALVVQSRDLYGNAAPASGALSVSLSSTSAGGQFYADASCQTAAAGATISSGSSSASIYFKDTRAGTATVTASASGITPASQLETINPAAPSVLSFITSAQTVTAGSCSGAVTVRSEDVYGNAAPVGAATGIALSASPALGFFTDSACGSATTSVTLAAGATLATFHFKDTAAGTRTVSAQAAGLATATQNATIAAAAPNALVFRTAPQTLTAGNCSAAATVEVVDTYGNPSALASTLNVTLSSDDTATQFFADSACGAQVASASIPAGQSAATFYFRDTRAGSKTLTVSAGALVSASQGATISPATATRLVYATATQSLTAGACSGVATLQTEDAFGNAAPAPVATSISLATTSSAGAFYSDSGCTTLASTVALAAGAGTVSFYFQDTRAGAPTLTASATGYTAATQNQTIVAAAPNKLSFTSLAQTVTAGSCSSAVGVQVQDAFGNPSNVGSATTVNLSSTSVTLTFSPAAGCGSTTPSVGIAAGSSGATFWFQDPTAGTPTVTVSVTGLASATQTATVNPAPAARLAFTSLAQTLTVGGCSAAATVRSQDNLGNPSPVSADTTLVLATTSTGGTFYGDSSCQTAATTASIANGQTTATFYFKDTRAGTPTLTASSTGFASATQTQTLNAGTAARIVFVSAPQSLIAGDCSALYTVRAEDSFANTTTVPAATTVALATDSAGGGFFSDSSCGTGASTTSIAANQSSATFYYRDTKSGSPLLTATVSGITPATQTQTLSPAAVAKLIFTTAAQTLTAGSCSAAITVQAQDTFNNPSNVASATSVSLSSTSPSETFASDSACGTAVASATIPAGQSAATFYMRDTKTGSWTLTGASGALSAASQPVTVGAASAAALVVTSAAKSFVAGACSTAVTLVTQDSFGNVSNVSAAAAVTLSSSSSGNIFYSDSACGNAVTSVTVAAGQSTQSYFFKDTTVGSPTHTLSATGLGSTTQTHTLGAATATVLAFTSAAPSQTAGSCSGQLTVRTRDQFGNTAAVTANKTLNLATNSAGGAYYSNPTCTAQVTNVTVASGQSTANFYYRDTRSGAPLLTVSSGGFSDATQTGTINPAAPTRFAFTSAAPSLTAGNCSAAITVQSQDSFGNASSVSTAQPVALATGSTGGAFYSDSACGTQVSSATIAAAGDTATFYYRDTRSGTATLTVSASGFANATQNATISAAGSAKLVFTTPVRSHVAGTCAPASTVQRQDQYGNAATSGGSLALTVTSSSAGNTFYSNSGCTTALSAPAITNGQSNLTFYWRDTRSGSPTHTVTGGTLTAATQTHTITANTPVKVVFTTTSQPRLAGACSGALTVQTQDTYSNASSVSGNTNVGLSTTSAGGTFYSDSSCLNAISQTSIPSGQSAATFFYKDTVSGTPTVTVTAAGISAPTATQNQTINAAPATQLVFSTTSQTVTAGSCSPLTTFRTRDVYGNLSAPTANAVVNLATSSTRGAFYSDAGCSAAITGVTVAAGATVGNFYWKDLSSGAPTLTLSATGFTNGTQPQTVSPATPFAVAFINTARTLTAGGCSQALQLRIQDTHGNASPVATSRSVQLQSASTSGLFYSDSSCTNAITSATVAASASDATVFYGDTKSGDHALTASTAGLQSGTQSITVNPAAAVSLAYTTPQRSQAAGDCSLALTVQSRDAYGNASPVPASTLVTLGSTSSAGAFYADASCNAPAAAVTLVVGTSQVTFHYQDTRSGAPALTASNTGLGNATQTATIAPAPAARVVFRTTPQSLPAGDCSAQLTVATEDSFGNDVAATAATQVQLTASRGSAAFYADTNCGATVTSVSISSGSSTAAFRFKDTASGSVTLTASVSGLQAATQTQTLTAASATRLAFSNTPLTQNAGACSAPLVVQTRDVNGNVSPVGAATTINLSTTASSTGAFYSDSSCLTAVSARTVNVGESQTTFFYKDTAVGTPALTAAASGFSSAAQTLTVTTAGTATRLVFLTPQRSITAGGCSLIASVQTQDSFGNSVNAASNLTLSLSTTSSQGSFFSDSSCGTQVATVGITAGQNTASFYYRDTRAGAPTVTVAATGLSNGTQGVLVSAGTPSQLLFTSLPQPFTAGDCKGPFTLITADSFGNASAVSAPLGVDLTSSSTAGEFFTDNACQSVTAQAAVAAAASTASFYYRDTKTGAPTLTAAATNFTSATQAQSVVAGGPTKVAILSSPQVVSAGACSGAVTLQLQDGFNNAANVTADTTVGLTSSSATLAFFTDGACTQLATTANVPSGAASVDVYFKDASSGSVVLTASSAGLTSGTQTHTIASGTATNLAYVTAAQSLDAGECSGAITIEMRDPLGNAAVLGQNLTVVLETDSTGGTYHADAACGGGAIQSRSIPAGQSRVTVYYRDGKAGSWQLGATNPGLYSANQAMTISAGSAAKVAFVTAAQAMTAGSCSAVTELEAQDAFGNATDLAAAQQATLTSSSASTQFFSDSGCNLAITQVTLPATAGRAAFYFRDNAAGTVTLTASSANLTPATQTATFSTGAAVRLGFGNPARIITAGSCSQALLVQPQDGAGNAVALGQNAVVSLSASSATAGFFSNGSCGTPITQVTIPVGSTSATVYVKDNKAGALTVTAATPGLASGAQVQTVRGAAPIAWAFTTTSQTLTAGSCSQAVTLQTRDSFGNAAPNTAPRPVALTGSTATMQFFSDLGCQTPLAQPEFAQDATELTFHFKESAAGAVKVFARSTGLSDLEQQHTVQAGAASTLFINAPAIVGVNACSRASTVKVADTQGNAVSVSAARTVALSSNATTTTFYSDQSCANAVTSVSIAAGTSVATFFFKDTAVGAITLDASSSPFTAGQANVNVVQPQAPVAIAFVTPSHTMEAGSCSPAVSFEIQDQTGAASPLTAARAFTLAPSTTTFAAYSDATCSTKVTSLQLPAGESRGTLYVSNSVVELATLTVASSGLSSASQSHTTVCPVAVDGARCDDADFCNGRESCVAGACTANTADSCDDQDACTLDSCQPATGCVNAVSTGCCQAPRQASGYNAAAAVGVPYRVSVTGRAELERGTGPITWSLCDAAPTGFNLDAVTGAVSWVPGAVGPASLCFRATGACGFEEQRFAVNVQPTPTTKPTAALTLSSNTVATGASVSADGSQSTPSNLFAYEWKFGDGSPAKYGVTTSHAYLVGGSYPVRLRVYDMFGQFAEATDVVAATSSSCDSVQRTAIRVMHAAGAEVDATGTLTATAEVTASLEADYAGDAQGTVFNWDFGDGETAKGKAVSHTFKPGRGTVVLEVLGKNGCSSFATLGVAISDGARQPPHCALSADPTSGPAPLVATFAASFGDVDGQVTSAGYSFSDGVSSDALRNNAMAQRTLERVGTLVATLTVVDDQGLACRTSATVRATNQQGVLAPEITSRPTLTARCGEAYVYGEDGSLTTTGTRPITYSVGRGDVGAPEGFAVSEEGVVSWIPAQRAGPERVTLVAENAAGAAQQDFVVEVECPGATARPCGCSAFSAAPMLLLAALGLGLRRRRPRSG